MKLLVCISKTPDTISKVRFDETGKKFIAEGVQYILNPYDEWYSLVKAIELKEKHGGHVDVFHVGDQSSEILIRKALAIGADAAFRVNGEPTGSLDVAFQISEFVKKNPYDIVLLGKETIDHNGSEVGSRLAELLMLPFVSYCSHLEFINQKAVCTVDIEGGIEIVEVATPFIISAAKGLAEQRIPNMKGIIDAKKKSLQILTKLEVNDNSELINFELPPGKAGVRMIDADNLDELVDVFKNELKII